MNLKLDLLIRMTLVALLCWVGVSVYVIANSGRRMANDLGRNADQIQQMLNFELRRQLTAQNPGVTFPDLAGVSEPFSDPMCLHYRGNNGSVAEQGCSNRASLPDVPGWFPAIAKSVGNPVAILQREIGLWGQAIGVLQITPDEARLLERQWQSISELLSLTAVTLLALGVLALVVINNALRPAGKIVAALDGLGGESPNLRMEPQRPREFGLIVDGINRLTGRLNQLSDSRAELTARLIALQESEQRELAHELHDDLGQCVAAIGAIGAGLRQSLADADEALQADVEELESAVDRARSALRNLLLRVRPPTLEQHGLLSALQDLVTGWQARLRGSTRIVVDAAGFDSDGLTQEQALCVYRLVQECLANVARHAPDSRMVLVRLVAQGVKSCVRISNDRTIPAGSLPPSTGSGMGLRLLAERVRSLRGSFCATATEYEFIVQAELPQRVPI
jgi:signal transduction histidine kinase